MKIKSLLAIIVVFTITFSSCQDDESLTPNPVFNPEATGDDPKISNGGDGNGDNQNGGSELLIVGEIPSTFTQKVILEEITGEWCGWCPEGAKIMNDEINKNPNTVIGIAIHNGDPMTITEVDNFHRNTMNPDSIGVPRASINRAKAVGRGSWSSQISTALTQSAKAGIAMVSESNSNILNLDVYVAFDSLIQDSVNITVLITENDVPQTTPEAQENYSTTVTVDSTWTHSHVLRGLITEKPEGDLFTLNSSEEYTKLSFNDIDLSNYNIINYDNVHIVAFLHTTQSPGSVYNAQFSGLNEIKSWD